MNVIALLNENDLIDNISQLSTFILTLKMTEENVLLKI